MKARVMNLRAKRLRAVLFTKFADEKVTEIEDGRDACRSNGFFLQRLPVAEFTRVPCDSFFGVFFSTSMSWLIPLWR
jgi:hypothetical protein